LTVRSQTINYIFDKIICQQIDPCQCTNNSFQTFRSFLLHDDINSMSIEQTSYGKKEINKVHGRNWPGKSFLWQIILHSKTAVAEKGKKLYISLLNNMERINGGNDKKNEREEACIIIFREMRKIIQDIHTLNNKKDDGRSSGGSSGGGGDDGITTTDQKNNDQTRQNGIVNIGSVVSSRHEKSTFSMSNILDRCKNVLSILSAIINVQDVTEKFISHGVRGRGRELVLRVRCDKLYQTPEFNLEIIVSLVSKEKKKKKHKNKSSINFFF